MPKPAATATTRESLSATIKTIRNIMRKDKGLNGDLDRLPMLTWLMMLKFLDDAEDLHKTEAELADRPYQPLLEPPYRWRDWAAPSNGITGDELKAFINQDEATLPDGKRGPGLFAYLKTRSGGRGDVVANVFRELQNRMVSGYLLRDVINKINEISFKSSEGIHTLSHLYESMLREMRDAAGDSGEFYTPRPIVRFMIKMLDPKLGEKVLDPACGTGGFLVEAYEHMKLEAFKAQDYDTLQNYSIFGNEAKPLPYLLSQMNLVLHGVESPNISIGNSLAVKLTEIGDSERVDVIATNPPFGGEEESSIQNGFPADKRTSETALLFLQLIMRKLKRQPKPGRAAVVVPNGVLFGDGIAARIKEELLRDFNLHTIVRIGPGAFAPYTDIPTNIIFFDRSHPSEEIHYFEVEMPEGRKKYSKTAPISDEDFQLAASWWNARLGTESAWAADPETMLKTGANLDLKNPNRARDSISEDPTHILARMMSNSSELRSILKDLQENLN